LTDDQLRSAIRERLRTGPATAAPLVTRLARRAAARESPRLRAEARFWRGELELARGRVAAAAPAYEDAAAFFGRAGPPRMRLATHLGRLQVRAQLGEAGLVRRIAASLRRGGDRDAIVQAIVENAIGTALVAVGDDAGAEASFRAALGHLGRRRNTRADSVRATALHNLAIRLARRGDVPAALHELERADALFERLGWTAWRNRALHNRGWILGLAGRCAEAFEDLRAAQQAFEAAGNRRSAGLALLDQAELTLRLGAPKPAAEAATAAARKLAAVDAARARMVGAQALWSLGRKAAARRAALRAREAFAAAGDKTGVAMADLVLGQNATACERTLRRHGHWLAALEALLCRELSAPRLREALRAYPAPLRRWLAPEIERRLACGSQKIPRLRRAFRAAEQLRDLAPAAALRARALRTHHAVYIELAEALLARGSKRDRKEAFLVIDAIRSRTLRDELEREAPGLWADQRHIRDLRQKIETLWLGLERRERGGGDLRRAQAGLFGEVRRLEGQLQEALSLGPATARAGRPATSLPAGAVLSFAVLQGGRQVVALHVRDGEVSSWSCGPLAEARELAAAFGFQVQRRLHGPADAGPARDLLARLDRFLLGGRTFSGRLGIVVPPGLGKIPIEALPGLEGACGVQLPWACTAGRKPARTGRGLIVGIGSDELPEIAREIDEVSALVPDADVLEGPRATRAAVLDALGGRSLVHLAAHAASRDQAPLLSALRAHDGWITASDMATRQLNRCVIVLSACRTGDPALRWEGEALAGFPHALLGAGAAAVVASRWEVRDPVARAWMRTLHDQLRRHELPDAVQQTARRLRRSYPHPADWAAFLLVYNGSPS